MSCWVYIEPVNVSLNLLEGSTIDCSPIPVAGKAFSIEAGPNSPQGEERAGAENVDNFLQNVGNQTRF